LTPRLLEVECDGEEFEAAPGSFVFLPCERPHTFRSVAAPPAGCSSSRPAGWRYFGALLARAAALHEHQLRPTVRQVRRLVVQRPGDQRPAERDLRVVEAGVVEHAEQRGRGRADRGGAGDDRCPRAAAALPSSSMNRPRAQSSRQAPGTCHNHQSRK
jgi:hypothetical protein